MRRVDRANYNIEMLGLIEEIAEQTIDLATPPPNEHQIYRENSTIPPPDRIRNIAKLFGGTVKENKIWKEN